MLSRSYVQAHDEAERINANLEELVKQRTAQLNHANHQLKASQTALQEMIGNISHDLKTPLTVLNNYLELLGDDMIAPSEQERTEYLGIAYHKNLDLQRLIHNLFEVTRMEGGTIVYHPEWVCAGSLIEEADRKYGDLVRDKGITFLVQSDHRLELKIDKNKIWSILDNLIYNGLRHTPEGGEKDGSSGLGLYIVKTTAESMGGSVRVESTLGKGTVFTVTFSAR